MRYVFSCLVLILTYGCAVRSSTLVPVTITASDIDDPCGAVGRVTASEKINIPLRAAPGITAPTKLMLVADTHVLLCEMHNGWHGVVILETGKNCISEEYKRFTDKYKGPCQSGWIRNQFVELFAG